MSWVSTRWRIAPHPHPQVLAYRNGYQIQHSILAYGSVKKATTGLEPAGESPVNDRPVPACMQPRAPVVHRMATPQNHANFPSRVNIVCPELL